MRDLAEAAKDLRGLAAELTAAHAANPLAAAAFGAEGAYETNAARAALATFSAPVLLLAGALDVAAPPRVVAQFADLFGNATLVIQPEAGHFPWLDDCTWFTSAVATFLE